MHPYGAKNTMVFKEKTGNYLVASGRRSYFLEKSFSVHLVPRFSLNLLSKFRSDIFQPMIVHLSQMFVYFFTRSYFISPSFRNLLRFLGGFFPESQLYSIIFFERLINFYFVS